MRKLDRSRKFGTIIGTPEVPPGGDRPAAFTQDGRNFDLYDREIVPGLPLDEMMARAAKPANGPAAPTLALAGKGLGGVSAIGADAFRRAIVHAEAEAMAHLAPAESPFAKSVRAFETLTGKADTLPWPDFRKLAKVALGKDCPAKKPDILKALGAKCELYRELMAGEALAAALAEMDAPVEAPPASQLASADDDDAGEGGMGIDTSVSAAGPPPVSAEPAKEHFKGLTFDGVSGRKPAPAAAPQPLPAPQMAPAQAAPAPQPATAPTAANGTGVDLAAWGRGQRQYLFGEVRKEIDKRFAISVTERKAAVDALIDQGVITFKEARKDV